jgi:O-methyltransferase involved in polyketide biosynthesis
VVERHAPLPFTSLTRDSYNEANYQSIAISLPSKIAVTLQSTLVGPLWARATYSQKYPDLLSDNQSVQLVEKVKAMHPDAQAEFATMEQFINEFYGLTLLIRARIFDDAIRAFLSKFSNSTIVNIGCGLDTTFSRVDNGRILWYDLDLPDVIEYRRQLISDSTRNIYIAKSAFDPSWLEEISSKPDNHVFCFAGGLFHYFPESDVATLVDAMARQFPTGELCFDMPSRLGIRILKQRFRSYGIEGIDIQFGLGNAQKQLPRWSQHVQVLDWFPMFNRILKNPKWRYKTRLMMWLSDRFKVVSFVHVKFKP